MKPGLAQKGLLLVSLPIIWGVGCILWLSLTVQNVEREVDEQIAAGALLNQFLALHKFVSESELLCYQLSSDYAGNKVESPAVKKSLTTQLDRSINDLGIASQNLRHNFQLDNTSASSVDAECNISNKLIELLKDAKRASEFSDSELVASKLDTIDREVHSLAEESRSTLDTLIDAKHARLLAGHAAQERSSNLVKVSLGASVVSEFIVCLTVAWLFAVSIIKRVDILTDNAKRFGQSEDLLPLLSGDDEIAQFDQLFHTVANGIQEARRKEIALLEKSADVIFSIDGAGVVQRINNACWLLWQRSSLDVLGKHFIDLVLQDDKESVKKALDEKGTVAIDTHIDSRIGPLACKISFSWSDIEQMYFCIAHDITARKLVEEVALASEKKMRITLDSMMIAVVITSIDGIIESVNKSAEQIFGYSEQDLRGRHVMCVFSDAKIFSETNEKDIEVFKQSLHQKALNRLGEWECLRRDGELFAVEVLMNPVETAHGSRYLLGISDVSETKQAEKTRKEFVSTVSHELRTPLTSIRGSLTLLTAGAMGALPEKMLKMVVVAERNVLRLIALINDILDIEKLESGKLDMVFENVKMSSVLERSGEAVKSFAEQHEVLLDIQPTETVVYADGDRLIQVLVNLMSNACKFSPKGAAVTVAVEEENDCLSVKVTDRGRGIPEKFKKLLFQRFQQVEAADATKKGGTGLGLAICKGIIEAHGGTIGVDSEEGKGSTFWYRIPIKQAQQAPQEVSTIN